jgi:hypothetical protein
MTAPSTGSAGSISRRGCRLRGKALPPTYGSPQRSGSLSPSDSRKTLNCAVLNVMSRWQPLGEQLCFAYARGTRGGLAMESATRLQEDEFWFLHGACRGPTAQTKRRPTERECSEGRRSYLLDGLSLRLQSFGERSSTLHLNRTHVAHRVAWEAALVGRQRLTHVVSPESTSWR